MSHRIASALAVLVLAACGERERATQVEPRRGEEEGRTAAMAPAGRADEPRASGRRGDRHARASAQRAPPVKRVEGTLARASDRVVVIRQSGAPELTLRVAPDTTVTVNGRPARIETLREGAEVRAAYQTGSGGRPTAISIEARSSARAGDASPPPPEPDVGGSG